MRLTRPGARKIRGVEAKRAEKDCARRSGASAVVGWPVMFCITQRFPLARMGAPAGRPRMAIGRKKTGEESEGKGQHGEIASVYTQAAAQTSLLRDGYIFWQRSMVVKQLEALESDSSGGFAENQVGGHGVVGWVQLVLANEFFESGKSG